MTLQANASGVLSGKFTIPANVPAGTKMVTFTGSGGSHGDATFIGQGQTLIETRQMVTTINVWNGWWGWDPLAQTFTLDSNQQIGGVDLWFTAKGSRDVVIHLRETTAGFPNQTTLASARVIASAINLGGASTRFSFPSPVNLNQGVEYAIVVMCDDAVTECGVAELGKWDSVNGRWVTAQPYQVGVLLSSSNASTWTAHQDRDLTFRLIRANYTETTKMVTLGTVAVTSATDLIVRANVENPSSNTGCDFRLTLPDGSTMTVAAEQAVRLTSAVTGNIIVDAILRGSITETPILHRDVFLLHGAMSSTGDYVTRAINGGTNVRVKVILEANLPGTSSLVVQAKGIDVTDTWAALTSTASSQMDDGWMELSYESATITETMVHAKLILNGNPASRPQVRNLRVLVV